VPSSVSPLTVPFQTIFPSFALVVVASKVVTPAVLVAL
jgi:hypothetical protein